MTDLEKLNEAQRAAVLDTEGAVLVFAGAGSGKTRVLTHRIVYLIDEKHVPARNILAITFTNKATAEMKERLEGMLGPNDVWVSTFHSLCLNILHRFCEDIGYSPNFSIFDETASKRMLLRVIRNKHLEEDDKDKYAYHIGKAKNEGLKPDAYFNKIRGSEKDAMLISEVYEGYDALLKENNAMDFDDLLIRCYELLQNSDRARGYCQNKFRYIHVDEFQDTNAIQFELLKIISAEWGNIFVVGDDDQSIYGWRGANVRNILDFDKFFTGAKVHKLEQNYRSTQPILDCANRLIANNKARAEKTLFTSKNEGAKVEYFVSGTEYEEVDRIVGSIVSLKRSFGYTNSDFAILVRNNSLTRLFETNLKRANINYKVYGGFRFFDRKEILDVVAYMRILVNPKDSEALTRIINFPARGIGDTTVSSLSNYAENNGISLYDAVMDVDTTDLSTSVKTKVGVFRDLIGALRLDMASMKFVDFAGALVEKAGFEKYYRGTGKEEDENRWQNIEEFLTFVQENFEDNEKITLDNFLQELALDNGSDTDGDDDINTVTIATMHSAKGLEFKVVFIVACEEGIIPSVQSIRNADGVDEERRVMYVAVTRAQERLFISAVRGVRRRFYKTEEVRPSRFFDEARGENRESLRAFSKGGNEIGAPSGKYVESRSEKKNVYIQPKADIDHEPKILKKSAEGFRTGAKISHKKYGRGTVISVSGEGIATTVTVAFPGLGVKKFALMSAPIELIND